MSNRGNSLCFPGSWNCFQLRSCTLFCRNWVDVLMDITKAENLLVPIILSSGVYFWNHSQKMTWFSTSVKWRLKALVSGCSFRAPICMQRWSVPLTVPFPFLEKKPRTESVLLVMKDCFIYFLSVSYKITTFVLRMVWVLTLLSFVLWCTAENLPGGFQKCTWVCRIF